LSGYLHSSTFSFSRVFLAFDWLLFFSGIKSEISLFSLYFSKLLKKGKKLPFFDNVEDLITDVEVLLPKFGTGALVYHNSP
jgi:hypothetical protein